MADNPTEPDLDAVDSGWDEDDGAPLLKPKSVPPVATDVLDDGWEAALAASSAGEVSPAHPAAKNAPAQRAASSATALPRAAPRQVARPDRAPPGPSSSARSLERTKQAKARKAKGKHSAAERADRAARKAERRAQKKKERRERARETNARSNPSKQEARVGTRREKGKRQAREASPAKRRAPQAVEPTPPIEPPTGTRKLPLGRSRSRETAFRVAVGVLMAAALLMAAWLFFRK